jgi:hypothetical protein
VLHFSWHSHPPDVLLPCDLCLRRVCKFSQARVVPSTSLSLSRLLCSYSTILRCQPYPLLRYTRWSITAILCIFTTALRRPWRVPSRLLSVARRQNPRGSASSLTQRIPLRTTLSAATQEPHDAVRVVLHAAWQPRLDCLPWPLLIGESHVCLGRATKASRNLHVPTNVNSFSIVLQLRGWPPVRTAS